MVTTEDRGDLKPTGHTTPSSGYSFIQIQLWILKKAPDAAKCLTSLLAMSLDMQFSCNVRYSSRKCFLGQYVCQIKFWPFEAYRSKVLHFPHKQAKSLTHNSVFFSTKLYNVKFLKSQLSPSRTVKSQH